jgi:hypothetical protein
MKLELLAAALDGIINQAKPAQSWPSGISDDDQLVYPTFRTLTVHYLRLATGRVSEGELLARTVDGGLYREQLKYLRLNRC